MMIFKILLIFFFFDFLFAECFPSNQIPYKIHVYTNNTAYMCGYYAYYQTTSSDYVNNNQANLFCTGLTIGNRPALKHFFKDCNTGSHVWQGYEVWIIDDKCPNGMFFDFNSSVCKCPANTYYNANTNSCVSCMSYDSSDNSCVDNSGHIICLNKNMVFSYIKEQCIGTNEFAQECNERCKGYVKEVNASSGRCICKTCLEILTSIKNKCGQLKDGISCSSTNGAVILNFNNWNEACKGNVELNETKENNVTTSLDKNSSLINTEQDCTSKGGSWMCEDGNCSCIFSDTNEDDLNFSKMCLQNGGKWKCENNNCSCIFPDTNNTSDIETNQNNDYSNGDNNDDETNTSDNGDNKDDNNETNQTNNDFGGVAKSGVREVFDRYLNKNYINIGEVNFSTLECSNTTISIQGHKFEVPDILCAVDRVIQENYDTIHNKIGNLLVSVALLIGLFSLFKKS